MIKLCEMTELLDMSDRLVQIVKQEMGLTISSVAATELIYRVEVKGANKSPLPLWMSAYLHLSRRMNRPISPEFAVHARIIRYLNRPYRPLNERAVYADTLTFVYPLY